MILGSCLPSPVLMNTGLAGPSVSLCLAVTEPLCCVRRHLLLLASFPRDRGNHSQPPFIYSAGHSLEKRQTQGPVPFQGSIYIVPVLDPQGHRRSSKGAPRVLVSRVCSLSIHPSP